MRIYYPQERWSQAYTANVSIGQGYDLATPLQMAMAYATVANRGISYYPRLVKKVLNQDGTPVLDEDGKIAVPDQPKVHADFRTEVSPADIELERRGFWNVVNADGGTGGRARLRWRAGRRQNRHRSGEVQGQRRYNFVVCLLGAL